MSQQLLSFDFSGISSASNPFGKAPAGAMDVADNVVCRHPGLLEPRPGFESVSIPSSVRHNYIAGITGFGGQVMVWPDVSPVNIRCYDPLTGAQSNPSGTAQTTFWAAQAAGSPVRFAQSAQSLFFTTAYGVQLLDTPTGLVANAGAAVVTDATLALDNVGADATWFATATSVAYRFVLCRFDANNNLIQGAPSPRYIITNASGSTQRVSVTVTLPYSLIFWGGPYTYFLQVYRSVSVASTSTPSDEMHLVREHYIQPAELTAQLITVSDVTSDSFCSASPPLYTNAQTGDGVDASNDLPPLAQDICAYGTRLLYANTTQRHSVDLTIVGVGSGTGLQVNDIITVAGKTYKAAATTDNTTSPPQFAVYTAGTAAQNIETTARNFCSVINYYNAFVNPALALSLQTPFVRATYTSTDTDVPGQIQIQELYIGGASWTVSTSAHPLAWSPDLTSATTSDNETRPARIYYSHDGEPWAVPLDNWLDVGSSDKAILRVVVLRSTVFIFKEDGLFILTGDTPDSYGVRPFDTSLRLVAPESIASLQGQLFCLTEKGVVTVSESGVSPTISHAVDGILEEVQGQALPWGSLLASASTTYSQTQTQVFAVANERTQEYILFYPSGLQDTGCLYALCFNSATLSWTRWVLGSSAHCGMADPVTGKLMLGVGLGDGSVTAGQLYIERKSFDSTDYQDPSGAAIACSMRWLPAAAGNPLAEKCWESLYLSFLVAEFTTATVGFGSEKPSIASSATVSGPSIFAWGSGAWGALPWGSPSQGFILRKDVPQASGIACTLGVSLSISVTAQSFQLQGVGLLYEPSTTSVRR